LQEGQLLVTKPVAGAFEGMPVKVYQSTTQK
jgi:hypothetical protein